MLSLHEHLPPCLLAWQRRFADIEASLQEQDGEATRTQWCGMLLPLMKFDPKWLRLALEYATTTLQELSALQKSISIGGFLWEQAGYPAPHLPLFLLVLLPRGDEFMEERGRAKERHAFHWIPEP